MVRSALIATFAFLLAACNSTAGMSPTATSSLAAPNGTSSAEPMGSSSPTPIAQIDGQLVLVDLLDPVETYLVWRDGELRQFAEATQCNPCLSTSPDGRFAATPYAASGDKFGTAVYDLVTNTTDELLVPEEFDGLGPGPFDPTTGRLLRVGWSDTDPTKAGYYTSGVNGSDLQDLAHPAESDGGEVLAWSADGSSLLVYREDGDRPPPPHLGELGLYSLDTDAQRRLTPDGTSIEPIVYSATAATFSADGIMAAFAGKQDADPEQSALFVADVSGGPARQLTGWGPGTRNAIFSPTDEWIVFDRTDGEGSSLWVIKPDGSDERQIWSSTEDGPGCCPSWSPDGARILFQRGQRPDRSFWVMDLAGTVEGQVDLEPANWIWSRWTPAP